MNDEDRNLPRPLMTPTGPGGPLPRTDDGVDVTLIRWMLRLTPAERLRALERNVRSILRLRDARRPS